MHEKRTITHVANNWAAKLTKKGPFVVCWSWSEKIDIIWQFAIIFIGHWISINLNLTNIYLYSELQGQSAFYGA